MTEIKICEYGCGRPAVHQFKNGKWCCETTWKKCPVKSKQIGINTSIQWVEYRRINKRPKPDKCDYCHTYKAKYYFPTSKTWCCEDNVRRCPAQKELTAKNNRNREYKPHTEETKLKISILKKGSIPWNKGKTDVYSEKTLEIMSNSGKRENLSEETLSKMSRSSKGRPAWNKGKTGIYTEETLNKIRLAARLQAIRYRQERTPNGYQIFPNYSPNACILIDEYAQQNNFKFQHAENGGEYHIKELGYWVDGYDAEKNTVIEVDEPFHYDNHDNLTERDIRRQNEIIEFLDCDFIRMKLDSKNNVIDVTLTQSNNEKN